MRREDLDQRPMGPGVPARLFHGREHGLADISLMFGELQPGTGPGLQRHTYEEAPIIHEGCGVLTIGETTVEAGPGDIILVPAGVPHRFVNTGDGPMRQTAVHAAETVAIEWLE